MEGKTIKVVFTDNAENVHFVNVFGVVRGTDDYFVKLGSIAPPTLSAEGAEQIEKVEIKPLFTFAVTKSSMKEFIRLLQDEYEEDE
jgi:hypothetical protein